METNMKHYLLALSIGTAFLVGCQSPQKQNLIDSNFAFAEQQLKYAFPKIDEARANESQESKEKRIAKQWGELTNPRNTEPDGSLRLVPSKDWTSGFFPGELWYVYEYTHDPFWKEKAEKHTEMLEREKKNGTTHDMGFKMYCSYGNGYRLTGNPTYKDILIESARTLITRYKPNVGCLRSWDHHADQWECPVIIDNMLNLELLFWASRETNDSTFYNIAVNHARTTMKNHFRDDYSTYHVVNYDTITGNPICKVTHQGYADSSAWARGQAWAVYGYTACFRETNDSIFLNFAKDIADMIMDRVKTDDAIPYWDYDAPKIPNEPRDASAAAITASALLELSGYGDKKQGEEYFRYAEHILKQLSSDDYLAKEGENHGFILLHSVGSFPHDSEIDTPLNYADYYYPEALKRYKELKEKSENQSY